MSGSYVQRQISVTFVLGPNADPVTGKATSQPVFAAGSNTLTLSNLRASAHVVAAGSVIVSLHLRVYGMTLAQMNQVTTLGKQPVAIKQNKVSVSAGDKVNGMSLIFVGTIIEAWVDFEGAPDVFLQVVGQVAAYASVFPVPPSSYKGSADAAVIMQNLATQMGFQFENNGVSVLLANPYFSGTARQQAEECAQHANINWVVDRDVLAIWPKTGSRGSRIPLISPTTGMRGYPTYTSVGMILTTLFNPAIAFGTKVKVESDLKQATGEWVVYSLSHSLESLKPNGEWFTTLNVAKPGYVPIG